MIISYKCLFAMLLLVIIGCSLINTSPEEKIADNLQTRINSVVRSGDGYSPEWINIKNRILNNQDTLFFVENPDFKIIVTMRHNMVIDSVKAIKDSTEQQKERTNW